MMQQLRRHGDGIERRTQARRIKRLQGITAFVPMLNRGIVTLQGKKLSKAEIIAASRAAAQAVYTEQQQQEAGGTS